MTSLFPVLVALQQWADKWTVGAGGLPIQMVEHRWPTDRPCRAKFLQRAVT